MTTVYRVFSDCITPLEDYEDMLVILIKELSVANEPAKTQPLLELLGMPFQ